MHLLPVSIIPSLDKRHGPLSMPVLQGYLKGALWIKQLIASFVEQFKLNLENIRCIYFQFHVAKGSVDSFSCRAS